MEDNKSTNQDGPKGKVLSADEVSNWGNDVNFIEPGTFGQRKPADDTTEDDSTDTTKEAPETTEDTDDLDQQESELLSYQDNNAPQDPGEFVPEDYSFTVALADGKSVTIRSQDDIDRIAEDPDNFATPKQLMDFLRQSNKMVQAIEKDQKDWQDKKDAYDKYYESVERNTMLINNIASELDYLVSNGDLPKLTEAQKEAEWTAEYLKNNPDVKAHDDVLKFMRRENIKRAKLKLPPVTSVLDAFNSMQLNTIKTNQSQRRTDAVEQRKTMSGRIASGAPTPVQANRPKGIAVGRVGNLRNLGSNWSV